jgi:hypothetical protein
VENLRLGDVPFIDDVSHSTLAQASARNEGILAQAPAFKLLAKPISQFSVAHGYSSAVLIFLTILAYRLASPTAQLAHKERGEKPSKGQ